VLLARSSRAEGLPCCGLVSHGSGGGSFPGPAPAPAPSWSLGTAAWLSSSTARPSPWPAADPPLPHPPVVGVVGDQGIAGGQLRNVVVDVSLSGPYYLRVIVRSRHVRKPVGRVPRPAIWRNRWHSSSYELVGDGVGVGVGEPDPSGAFAASMRGATQMTSSFIGEESRAMTASSICFAPAGRSTLTWSS
jgi:hypothetical protein